MSAKVGAVAANLAVTLTLGDLSQAAPPEVAGRIEARGTLHVRTIDPKRIVIAIDIDNDQILDHIFLFTSSEPVRVAPTYTMVPGAISYREGHSLVMKIFIESSDIQKLEFLVHANESAELPDIKTIRYVHTRGLSVYVPPVPISLSDFDSMRRTSDCDIQPDLCVNVAGQYLPFAN
jgi:hypothetical protein